MRDIVDFDAGKQVEYIKELHERTRQRLLQKANYNAEKANKGRRKVIFQPGDLVWVHLRKERFPDQRKNKLSPRGDGPFKVLQRIGDNAYKIELPGDYGVSATFNVADLVPYLAVDEELDLRTNPLQEREDDEGPSLMPAPEAPIVSEKPMTRARAKALQDGMTSFIHDAIAKEIPAIPTLVPPHLTSLSTIGVHPDQSLDSPTPKSETT